MKILRSSVSAEPWLGTTGGRNLGSTGSSGSARHTRSEIKVTRAKLLLPPRSDPPTAPALGTGAAATCNQPRVPRSQQSGVSSFCAPTGAWPKSRCGSEAGPAADPPRSPRSQRPARPAAAASALWFCATCHTLSYCSCGSFLTIARY